MSGRLTIEATDAASLGIPIGVPHLTLIYQDLADDREYVIRSGPESKLQPFGGDMKIETNVPIEKSADARHGETPAERHSTELDFQGLTDDQAWSIMVKYCLKLQAADFGYDLLGPNSNTFVAALLDACGGNPDDLLPKGIDSDEAIGFDQWPAMVKRVSPPEDGIFRGTSAADNLAGRQFDEVFRLYGGNDTLHAGGGKDQVAGYAGNDRIWGDDGGDLLKGDDGNDSLSGGSGRDRIAGGLGADLLAGGSNDDDLTGGAGRDVFFFDSARGHDTLRDFQAGEVLRFETAAVTGFDDLAATDSGHDTLIRFGDASVLLRGVGAESIDATDVQIVSPDHLLV